MFVSYICVLLNEKNEEIKSHAFSKARRRDIHCTRVNRMLHDWTLFKKITARLFSVIHISLCIFTNKLELCHPKFAQSK